MSDTSGATRKTAEKILKETTPKPIRKPKKAKKGSTK